jgi:sulfatase maturation enzyme AslB (radical SAM superfamily)
MDGSGRRGGDAVSFLIFSSVKRTSQSVAMAPEETSVSKHKEDTPRGLHVVAKLIGPICNLNCEYCFYFEKQAFIRARRKIADVR